MHLMGFVDEDEVNVGAFSPRQCLSAADLDSGVRISQRMIALNNADIGEADCPKPGDGLFDENEPGNDERDLPLTLDRLADQGLA